MSILISERRGQQTITEDQKNQGSGPDRGGGERSGAKDSFVNSFYIGDPRSIAGEMEFDSSKENRPAKPGRKGKGGVVRSLD